MAWQLIYTSAPRLLDAGRSGFGSVARHPQISPLLVSTIERASQFSRLPGLDPERIIHAYRVIPIAGGRFHVLSCIRDAGADYTGRTNHIAHHVIAEAREVSQLSPGGASPADVLLAMPWAGNWDEPPRHLGEVEEVRLAEFIPQTSGDGAGWAEVTGNPAHAWLLAAGEACRGAYLIPPRSADLRRLIAESLRLMPERMWQTPFTTALQPSDEVSDFRWVGLDADSPLRVQAGTSGRLVLDLTEPHRLPLPEIPAVPPGSLTIADRAADTVPLREGSAIAAPPDIHDREVLPAPRGRSAEPPARESDTPQTFPVSKRSTSFPIRIIVAAASLLIVAGALFFGGLPWLQLRKDQTEIEETLRQTGYFSGPASKTIAAKLLPDASALTGAKQIAKAANQLVDAMRSGDVAGLEAPQRAEALRQLHTLNGTGAPQIPGEIVQVRGIFEDATAISHKTPELHSAADVVKAQETARDEINKAIPRGEFDKLNTSLHISADEKFAKALLALLVDGRSLTPPDGANAMKRAIEELRSAITARTEAKKPLDRAAEIVAFWELAERPPDLANAAEIRKKLKKNRANLPEWLLKLANNAIAASHTESSRADVPPTVSHSEPNEAQPATASGYPIYLVVGNDEVKQITIRELEGEFVYSLITLNGQRQRLVGVNGKLRRDLAKNAVAFVVSDGKPRNITADEDAPPPPYSLIAESLVGNSVSFEIRVVAPDHPAPMQNPDRVGLARDGNALRVTGQLPIFANVSSFHLRTPDNFDGGKASTEIPLNASFEGDIASKVSALREKAKSQRLQAKTLREKLMASNGNPPSLETLRKKAVEFAAGVKTRDATREINPSAKNGAEIVGDCAVALAAENSENKDAYADLDRFGRNLRETVSHPEWDPKALNKQLQKAVLALDQKFTSEGKSKQLAELRSLTYTLAEILGDSKAAEVAALSLRKQADEADAEAARLEKLPLLEDARNPPPGEYRVLARPASGREVVIAIVNVPKT